LNSGCDLLETSLRQIDSLLFTLSPSTPIDSFQSELRSAYKSLRSMRNTNFYMSMMLHRCIDYTKASHGVRLVPFIETVDAQECLDNAVSCVRDLQPRCRLELSPWPTDASLYLRTDQQWLLENLLCLIANGVKYSPQGSLVTVKVLLEEANMDNCSNINSNSPNSALFNTSSKASFMIPTTSKDSIAPKRSSSVVVDCTMDPNDDMDDNKGIANVLISRKMLKVEVEDCGVGVPEHLREIMFNEQYCHIQRLSGGTGLGLYALARRCEALGGRYGVKNRNDGKMGSVFWFTIPYRPGKRKSIDMPANHNHNSSDTINNTDISYNTISNSSLRVERTALDTTISLKRNESTCSNASTVYPKLREEKPNSNNPSNVSNSSNNDSNTPVTTPVYNAAANTAAPDTLSVSSTAVVGHMHNIGIFDRRLVHDDETVVSGVNSIHSNNNNLAPNFTSLKILIVDDSLPILKMTRKLLEKDGHAVYVAQNGKEAVDMFLNRSTKYDAILMDIQMPIMDGLEATKLLRVYERQVLEEQGLDIIMNSINMNKDTKTSTTTNPTSIASVNEHRPPEQTRINKHSESAKHIHSKEIQQADTSRWNCLCIIGCSANADDVTVENAFNAGVNAFMPKPFKLDRFKELVYNYYNFSSATS
jgi:CheY-like chemotaxis protein/signal transduction histidine kinase